MKKINLFYGASLSAIWTMFAFLGLFIIKEQLTTPPIDTDKVNGLIFYVIYPQVLASISLNLMVISAILDLKTKILGFSIFIVYLMLTGALFIYFMSYTGGI